MAQHALARNPRRASFFQHLLVLAILTCPPLAQALPDARDLAADATRMREKKLPMLVLYSAAGCGWCERARREVLDPLAADPDSANRVVIRQIDIDRPIAITDFSGKATTASAFAHARKVRLTPTLVVLDADGRELMPAIVGVPQADFYGLYVDRAIETGLARLRGAPQ